MNPAERLYLWDLPTRLFHWLLALAVLAAFVSGSLGGNLIVWHGRIGLFILGLLAFRLAWGLFGSTYARFAQFAPTPARLAAYLRGNWQGQGHNPLGALSVFALLGLLGFQAISGLVSNDDIAFSGPLYRLVSDPLSQQLTGLHHQASDLLLLLIGLHLLAIGFYRLVKGDNLVLPMIRGWRPGKAQDSAQGGGPWALILALLFALLLVLAASGIWLPPPPPPEVLDTPAW
ncbi:MAG: cytochrome b/b6 domain-containing protein [Gammaproteobacteria bacterium SHHR-1]|uniref:cytochrome b/b6 domain-containing protein n=1 Tax=Magnetovirga frankeli TaxID=947516 RepID=UPI0012940241|nr:cytochrome b/b6 domain-containing protein [gamma proteobacterium SS-5]